MQQRWPTPIAGGSHKTASLPGQIAILPAGSAKWQSRLQGIALRYKVCLEICHCLPYSYLLTTEIDENMLEE